MQPKLNLIAAACSNGGIGINGDLPWRLKTEMAYFTRMTKTTKDPAKQNAVIMGRRTWDCIPLKYRPLAGRLNVVLTRQNLNLGDEAKVCNSLEEAVNLLQSAQFKDNIESYWVVGGSSIYEVAMASPFCHRVYLTAVQGEFECDTFFPHMDKSVFQLVTDPEVPQDEKEENGIKYRFQIFEKIQ